MVSYIQHVWLYSTVIKRSGDIKKNPDSNPNYCESMSICHWNLNRTSTHNFIKLSVLRAYISVNKFDIICL